MSKNSVARKLAFPRELAAFLLGTHCYAPSSILQYMRWLYPRITHTIRAAFARCAPLPFSNGANFATTRRRCSRPARTPCSHPVSVRRLGSNHTLLAGSVASRGPCVRARSSRISSYPLLGKPVCPPPPQLLQPFLRCSPKVIS